MESHLEQSVVDQQPQQHEDEQLLSSFDSYPWITDSVFLKGLIALLGGVNKLRPDPSHSDLTVHARIFYYQQARNARVDFATYRQWAAAAKDTPDRRILAALYWAQDHIAKLEDLPTAHSEDAIATLAQHYVPPAPGPAWQEAAPAQPLRVSQESAGGDAGSGAAPYPAQFAELIAAVQNNQPVPGVRDIPDTVIRDSNVKPIGKMIAPKKPWELGRAASSGEAPTQIDQDFPPIEGEA